MTAEKLTLKHPAVQAAKRKFLAGRFAKRCPVSFEDLFDFYDKYDHRGVECDVSKKINSSQRHHLYKEYFEVVFGETRKARQTRKSRLAAEGQVRELLETLPPRHKIARCAHRARLAGHKAELLLQTMNRSIRVARTIIGIDGHICFVQAVKKHRPRARLFRSNLEGAKALFLFVGNTLLIIPPDYVKEKMLGGKETSVVNVRLYPARGVSGNAALRRFINAWWVLSAKN